MAGAIKRGYGMPFVLFQVSDMKDPGNYGVYTYQAGIGLPDREYYFTDDDKSAALREQYVAHIEKMFALAGLQGGSAAAESR
jgi:putative endopeptidase